MLPVPSSSTLLTPGPVSVHPAVHEALCNQGTLHHRMGDFADLTLEIGRLLRGLFAMGDRYRVGLLASSGTGMTEALLSNLAALSPSGILILSNGEFGDRLAGIAQSLGLRSECLRFAPDAPLPLERVREKVSPGRADSFGAVAAVLHETSVGQVNFALREVLSICEERGALLGADLVSALGGERFDFEDFRPHLAVSVSGKALGAYPGVGIAIAREDLAGRLERAEVSAHYFRLSKYLGRGGPAVPFTPAIPLLPPLRVALRLIAEEGLEAKLGRHERGLRSLESLARQAGFERIPVLTPSSTTRTFRYASGQEAAFDAFALGLVNRGFVPLQNPRTQRAARLFQLSTMGYLPEERLAALARPRRRTTSGELRHDFIAAR